MQDVLGTSNLEGCTYELHPERVGFAGLFSKEAIYNCDTGNFKTLASIGKHGIIP
jgi:hypothetical protein